MTGSEPVALETHDPAHPAEVVGRFTADTAGTLDAKITAAERSQPSWATRARDRATALERWATAVEADATGLAALVAREVGKPIAEARAEVARAVAILRYYAQASFDPIGETFPSPDGNTDLATERVPLGVVLAITPWNFPLAIPAWKIAPALAYGNAVLFKPSSAALAVAHRFLQLAEDRVPGDVLHLLIAQSKLVDGVLGDQRIAGVSFTGSVAVGQRLILKVAGRGGAVQAEMGGQNPSIVLEDADMDLAATTIAGAAMAYAGQKCTATSRVIVLSDIADRFVPLLVEAVRALPVGDPLEDATVVGPLISEDARQSVAAAVQGTRRRGAELLTGGGMPRSEGWFYEPAVVRVSDRADPFVQEETFGPAVAIQMAADVDEAVDLANGTPFGLSAAVFGSDLGRATAVARRLAAGMVRVNASTTGVDFYAPFGGEKASSYGPREQGRAAREFYTRTRTLTIGGGR